LTSGIPRLKRVIALDVEHCPTCGSKLKIIAALLVRPVIGMILTRPRLQARALSQRTGRTQHLHST
jgi:hypothetical protein